MAMTVWSIDGDGWWWRGSRPTDPKIGDRSDVGFDDSTFPGRKAEGKVFVRERAYCGAIDAGRLPPTPRRMGAGNAS